MGRNLMAALRAGGAEVHLASEMRVYDRAGDPAHQADMLQAAKGETEHLIARGRSEGWQVWLTYHNYYKAPDLLGPAVSSALGLPYVLVEATRARKRLKGPWAAFAHAAERACDTAALIFYLTQHDAEALTDRAPAGQMLCHLRPFLQSASLPPPSDRTGPMLSVGMLRPGDKLASYALIAETLHHLQSKAWRLSIVGDGEAREDVAALMQPFGAQVELLGEMDSDALQAHYSTASLLLWPGVNEAFGFAYLEAQAAGLPVIAQNRPGVRDVLAPGTYPDPAQGPQALAQQVDALLSDPHAAQAAAAKARSHVAAHHLLGSATETLLQAIRKVM
jgi:hypothetical protein